MEQINKFEKIFLPFLFTIIIITPMFLLVKRLVQERNIQKQQPTEIIVANITPTTVQIYWKANRNYLHTFSYKEQNSTLPYKEISDSEIYEDNTSSQNVYKIELENLSPNTPYAFRIKSKDKVWTGYTFATKQINDEIHMPDIITGKSYPQKLILVSVGDNILMLDTQYHGTFAFDSDGQQYSMREYADYAFQNQLTARLNILLKGPVYAESGANCKTGVVMNATNYPPNKLQTVDILSRFKAGCPGGAYGNQCYEDAYCKSVEAGVDPAFTMTIWAHESAGSNYAGFPGKDIEDFGIHGSSVAPPKDFTAQLEHFLKYVAKESYIATCKSGSKSNEEPLYLWGAKYWTGGCSTEDSLTKGEEYINSIKPIYGWFTNESKSLTWPFSVPAMPGLCDYSSAVTNSEYNNCDSSVTKNPNQSGSQSSSEGTSSGSSGSSGTSSGSSSSSGTSSGTSSGSSSGTTSSGTGTKDGSRDEMIVSNKDRYCLDADGCQCLYDMSGGNAGYRMNIDQGYTCTPDKKSVKTVPVCCQKNSILSMQMPYDCTGEIKTDISESQCKTATITYSFAEGINFVTAANIQNPNEVPINTAKGLIQYSQYKIIAVGRFANGAWENIVKYEKGTINGKDFNLEPGQIYLVIASAPYSVTAQGTNVENSAKLSDMVGWNLIPASMLTTSDTTSAQILQNNGEASLQQIAQWDKDTGKFSYTIKDSNNQIYGDEITISVQDPLFIKIVK